MAETTAKSPSPRRAMRTVLWLFLLALVCVLAAGALWDFGYARQLNDLQTAVLMEVPVTDLQRGDPLAIAAASVQLEQGPPERAAGMQQFERVHPPFWKAAIHQQLLDSLRHWQRLDSTVLWARLGKDADEVMQRYIIPNREELLRMAVSTFGLQPEKGDPLKFIEDWARDEVVSPSFARLPDYQRARAESELLYKRARRIYFLF